MCIAVWITPCLKHLGGQSCIKEQFMSVTTETPTESKTWGFMVVGKLRIIFHSIVWDVGDCD